MSRSPTIVRTIPALRRALDSLRVKKAIAALVPTMGALHDGHASLVRLAKRRAAKVIVSIAKKDRARLRNGTSEGNIGANDFREGTASSASVRAIIFGGLMALAAGFADAQTPQRPAVGGIGSPQDAMIFYVARGAAGTCGPGCSEWIAAEGTVQWDTHKRLIAILDRQSGRKLPVIIHSWGESNLNVATSLGRILRERGIDTTAGPTEVETCNGKPEAGCFALKRLGGPLDAKLTPAGAPCDLACVLILAGGVHRSLPAGTKVILSGMSIHNRLAPNVSDERREGLTARFGDLFRLYARDMGFDPELFDIVDKNSEARRQTEMPPAEWIRLRIVTGSSL